MRNAMNLLLVPLALISLTAFGMTAAILAERDQAPCPGLHMMKTSPQPGFYDGKPLLN